jgi:hypothetical protein
VSNSALEPNNAGVPSLQFALTCRHPDSPLGTLIESDSDADDSDSDSESEDEGGNSTKKRLGYGKKEKEFLMSFAEAYKRARGEKAVSQFYTMVLAHWTKEQSPTYFTADYTSKDIRWELGENLDDPAAALSGQEIHRIRVIRKIVNRMARRVCYLHFSHICTLICIPQKITAFYRNHFNCIEAQAARQKVITRSIAKAALSTAQLRKQKAVELWYSQHKTELPVEINEEHRKNPTKKKMVTKNRVVARLWKALPAKERKALESETEKDLVQKLDVWKQRGTWSDTPEHYAR